MADLEGKNLDRYELRQLRGRGGMADVYLAYDSHFEREVAVKVFKREDEDLLRRFIREAQLMASLHNPHLMPVYDTGTCRLDGMNVYYIVMPFMDGGTLRARIRRAPIPLKQACRYLRDIADALDYMHGQGIIHRDIKSSNVLLDADGRCYLADFGIARTANDSTQLTSTGNVLGTVDYIAPELFESNYRADERSDYYSLGVLLYEMVTGHLPFVAENQIAVVAMHVNKLPPPPHIYVPNLSPAVENVMLRALEKQPEARYGSANELATAFCRASTARPTAKLPAASVQSQPSGAFTPSTRRQTVPPPASYPPTSYPPAPRPTPAVAVPADGYYGESPGQYAAQASLYPPPDLQKNHPARTQGWIVTMIAIIILLIIAIPVSYAVMKTINRPVAVSTPVPPTATPDLQSTAQAATATAVQQANGSATAVAQSTATVQAKATATATAKKQATATAQAKASATAGVIQTATAANPLYSDALSNPNDANTQAAQWDTNLTTCSFHDDGYHVTANQLNTFVGCHEAGKQFQNFTAQVDMSIQSGHSGGLFFRMDVGPLKGYLFEVDDKGNYKISVSKNYDLGSMTVLRDWTASPDLKTGTNKNRLQVIARDGTLLFYINGMYQPAPIQDATLNGGDIGFLAAWDQGEKTTVVYSNVSVYPLS
ncbi:serine/threonine protein kinase [Dictyobacter aurantiacus]|uniref:non-specific serine/threonine protein kinase n=1 Tax=Dictyobacter aurantiacus TaxID=1936993 RepID=A0A401ZAH4_9CHLR|nr:serine/threonine-protein kinase [Dictyobacter aurantiacus]GCE03855.1 hypothetical protein KDAU_11840 [Dictyobacter aurantiacus]